jgi:outer membrane receptor protein involved in Fe transport
MDDVINFHAGAKYRFNSNVSLWLQAHNLLNRRYDILYGMGTQRIGFMAGASFTF